jgi:hypothetical protein
MDDWEYGCGSPGCKRTRTIWRREIQGDIADCKRRWAPNTPSWIDTTAYVSDRNHWHFRAPLSHFIFYTKGQKPCLHKINQGINILPSFIITWYDCDGLLVLVVDSSVVLCSPPAASCGNRLSRWGSGTLWVECRRFSFLRGIILSSFPGTDSSLTLFVSSRYWALKCWRLMLFWILPIVVSSLSSCCRFRSSLALDGPSADEVEPSTERVNREITSRLRKKSTYLG